jgi:hypothetical protein
MKQLGMTVQRMEQELSRQEIERQDFVDNAIYDLLVDITDTATWDIAVIADIRDAIWSAIKDNTKMTPDQFYPHLEEP